MESPQLKGVVIITLPPADNPSEGKTITAFTLSDDPHPSLQSPPEQQQQQQEQLPIRSTPDPVPHYFFFRRFYFGSPRRVLAFLGISLLVVIWWNFAYSKTINKLRGSEDDRKEVTFIFTLYPKFGGRETLQPNVEFKLGRLVERDVRAVMAIKDGEVQHHENINSLSSASGVDSSTIFPVRGNIYPDGLYYTSMIVGNPPRPYYLDIDTGSDLTWIQCDAPCVSCAKGPNPFYKPTRGKLISPRDLLCTEVQNNPKSGYCDSCGQCDYMIEYADHSSSMGVLVRDELQMTITNGTQVKPNVVFGCGYDQQGQLLNSPAKTDGILGLSRAKASLPSQLASQGIINNVVGHCITSNAGGGGYMFLGDNLIPYWGMTWVPMIKSHSINFYQTHIVEISYRGGQLTSDSLDKRIGQVVFDSGSSYTYFTKQAYSDLITSLRDIFLEGLIRDESDETLPVCWRAKFPIRSVKDVHPYFKPLTLKFGNKWWLVSRKLSIPPEGYLVISKKGNVCLGILDGSNVHDGSSVILGDISLRGLLVVYDNVNQKIGWVQSNCVNPQRSKHFRF